MLVGRSFTLNVLRKIGYGLFHIYHKDMESNFHKIIRGKNHIILYSLGLRKNSLSYLGVFV